MAKIDFYKSIKTNDKTLDLKGNLIDMIQKVMDHPNTPESKMHKLARLRAYIDIQLKSL